jgi:membrane protein YqaA with SNARE-associated domain
MILKHSFILSGMDPLVFCTLCGVASSAVGYMLGCALYGVIWQWMNKDLARKMQEVGVQKRENTLVHLPCL